MRKPTRKTKNRPVEVIVEKGQQIPIYSSPVTAKGKTYDSFLVCFIQAGQRVRRRATTIDAARDIAMSAARQLADGVGHVATLTPAEVADFASATKMLRQHPGNSLVAVVAEWVAAQEALGGGSIVEACTAHRKQVSKESGFSPATLAKVYEDFIARLEKDNASDRYIEDCRSRMGRLKQTFQGYIHTITREDLAGWLDRLKVSPRTRKNFRTAAVGLFKFAKEQGHLPRNIQTEAELLPATKRLKSVTKDAEIGIYTPKQFAQMLEAAPAHLLPVLAIGGLAGLRSAEICRLKWQDIRKTEIVVQADNAKTGSRRVVPIVPALALWLSKVERGEAEQRVCGNYSKESALARAVTKALDSAGIAAVHNGLRHSFCTYRLADIKNAAQVALEAGNSPTMLFRHYRALATDTEGRAWFNVRPSASTSAKVVAFAA
jgi:integrase